MGYIIGTDEAGYGPNLGPLVISATVWRAPGDPRGLDLYDRLAPAVVREAGGKGSGVFFRDAISCAKGQGVSVTKKDSRPPLRIADSKAVYRNGQGFELLERAVLTSLACIGQCPETSHALWQALVRSPRADGQPWHADFDCPLPIAADAADLRTAATELQSAMSSAGVTLRTLRSRVLDAAEFNEGVAASGSKGAVLSQATVQLIADVLEDDMLEDREQERVLILCDKHGGRNYYGPLLQRQFPDPLIEVRLESQARSIYRFRRGLQDIEAHFCTCGEVHLPVALASMASKYLRETAMRAFNAFWQRHVPGLRPTAGYPGDAERFKAEISAVQQRLRVEDHVLWRCR
jgi:hypothetical protein